MLLINYKNPTHSKLTQKQLEKCVTKGPFILYSTSYTFLQIKISKIIFIKDRII